VVWCGGGRPFLWADPPVGEESCGRPGVEVLLSRGGPSWDGCAAKDSPLISCSPIAPTQLTFLPSLFRVGELSSLQQVLHGIPDLQDDEAVLLEIE
jgi:hypothetical protein